MDDKQISDANAKFWNELCGSQLAKSLGIIGSDPESLRNFDDWYFDFYPYLFNHIPFAELKGKDVLEVGLGYDTVSQKLAASRGKYHGLDIAANPVGMVKHRLQQSDLSGKVTQDSILEPPFDPQSFDAVIAIGCLHHTGDLQLAIERCRELLRPSGQLIFMVYYAYSYRRFRMAPATTLKYMVKELVGYRGVVGNSSARDRAAYDANFERDAAAHTDWISVRSLEKLCHQFSCFCARIENIDQESPFFFTPRIELLKTFWPRLVGLDLYATATN